MTNTRSNYRWLMIGLAFLAIIIIYLDRMALSYAITPLEQLFHLSNADFGIIASAFGVGYIIMTVVGGMAVDHLGARKVWSISAIIWSLACALLGLATGFWWLFCFRLLLGAAEGPGFPALTRVVADWLPMTERARALGLGLAAVPFASVIGAPLISHLVANFGWRISFILLGVLGIIWGILWYAKFRDKPQQAKQVTANELNFITQDAAAATLSSAYLTSPTAAHTTWKFMLSNPSLLANNYAFFAFGYLLFFALTWLPGYLQQTYGINLKQAGLFLIAPWLLSTLLILLGGVIIDRVWRNTHSIRKSRSHLIWLCQLLSALCFIPVIMAHSLSIALIFISLGLALGLMPNAAFYAINADLVKDRAATSLGIMDAAFAAAGILAPLITGCLATLTGNFKIAVLVMLVLSFTSALVVICFQHPDKVMQTHNPLSKPVN